MFDSFFDIDNRLEELSKNGDPLITLNKIIPWETFREPLEQIRQKERKSNAGRKPFDVILMFKILILQSMYNLSDDSVEFQICDRLSFMRFLNLKLGSKVPDAKTIWLFREQLGQAGLVDVLFETFDTFLRESGFTAKKGQIVDASIVQAPKQRNTREENEQIKNGETPEDWKEAKLRQKDIDARWVKKNHKRYYGYKNHIEVDVKHKFIRKSKVTPASTHDSQVFEELLDENNSSRDVWADSAYRSDKKVKDLKEKGFREHLQRKGCKHRKLTGWERQGNTTRARVRSRVEHVFGNQIMVAGNLIVRTIGLARANVKITLRNLTYNMNRLKTLKRMS